MSGEGVPPHESGTILRIDVAREGGYVPLHGFQGCLERSGLPAERAAFALESPGRQRSGKSPGEGNAAITEVATTGSDNGTPNTRKRLGL